GVAALAAIAGVVAAHGRDQRREPVGRVASVPRREMHDEVAEVGAEAVGAAEELSTVHDAEPEPVLDADDEKVVEAAPMAEPMLGEGDQVDVAVERHRDAEPLRQLRTQRHVALAEDRALPAAPGRALDDPGEPDADAAYRVDAEPGIGDGATDS